MSSIPQFVPSAFYNGVVRIDSPARNVMSVYEQDKKYFARNRKRRMYLRTIWPGEFGTSLSYSPRPFKIHILVKQLVIGVHEVTLVFIGNTFFDGSDSTDLEVIQVLIEMERLNGICPAEWKRFTESLHQYLNDSKPLTDGEAIN